MSESAPTPNEASVAGFEKGARGVTPPSSRSARKGIFLTDVIVELGFADRASIDEAEDAARTSGKTVEQILLDSNTVDENQLALALAERNGLDHVDLGEFEVDMKAAETVSRSVAARSGAVPIAFADDGALIVAVQDTFDALVVRRLETTTGRDVRPAIATVTSIRRLIEKLPDESAEQDSEEEVPRIKSQRDLQVDEPETAATEEPPAEQIPEPEPPVVEEAIDEAPAEEDLSSFDGLSMDLGPINMEPAAQEPEVSVEAADAGEELDEEAKREERLARELTEAQRKVAELEGRLEEAVGAAEEAVTINEKLRALRRAIDEKSS